jgi:hypothetical protein
VPDKPLGHGEYKGLSGEKKVRRGELQQLVSMDHPDETVYSVESKKYFTFF